MKNSFFSTLATVSTLAALAKLDPRAGVRNPKRLRKRLRMVKAKRGAIVSAENLKAEKAALAAAKRKASAAAKKAKAKG